VTRPDGGAFDTADLQKLERYAVHGVRLIAAPEKLLAKRSDGTLPLASEGVIGISAGLREAEWLSADGYTVRPNITIARLAADEPWHLVRDSKRGALLQAGSGSMLPPVARVAYVPDTYAYDYDGSQFGSRLVHGPDFVGGSDTAIECRMHGTGTSSFVGSAGYGVDPEATVVSIRIADCGGNVSLLAFSAAVDWIVNQGRTLYGTGPVNASWGGTHDHNPEAAELLKLHSEGFALIASAANNNIDASATYPCAGADICVGATDQSDSRSSWSNFGPKVQIYAPGDDISFVGPDGHSWGLTGTSASAPQVVGTLLLLEGQYPSLPLDRLKDIILQNATVGVLKNLGTGSINRLLYAGPAVEVVGTNFFRYASSAKRFTSSVQLYFVGASATASQWVDFYRGGKGADGRCQGKPYVRGMLSAGSAVVVQTGWAKPPAMGCFATELGAVFDRRVAVLP
jgi:hypothetical protein